MTALSRHLSGRLGYGLLLAIILHSAVLVWVQLRALYPPEPEPLGPLTVQLAPRPERKPEPKPPKSVRREAPKSKPTPAPAPQPAPAAKPAPAPSPAPAPTPATIPAPAPALVTPPPPPTISRAEAAATARRAAHAALQPLAPTPEVGTTPTVVGTPPAPLDPRAAEPAPALVKSQVQRQAASDLDSSSTQAALAAFDTAVAAHGVPDASATIGGASGFAAGASAGTGGAGSSAVQWDEDGVGCVPLELPEPTLPDSLTGDGTIYHIVVEFRVNLAGSVMRPQIVKGSSISALDNAALEAARRMSFTNCSREARGKIPYLVTPPVDRA